MLLKEIEAKPNWQATFAITRRTGRHVCLMRTSTGNFYWYYAEYDGFLPAGATMEYSPSSFEDAMKRGLLKLVKGSLPRKEMKHE